jgi:YjbE family integral membrane protein
MEHEFFLAVLTIIGIDLILGGDNALIIAMASKNLSAKDRNRTIILGTFIAVFLRICLATAAVYLLTIPYLQLAGGILLLYLGYHLLVEDSDSKQVKSSPSMWKAIRTIVLADLFMSFDNVIAVAGASHGNYLLVALGLMVSVPVIIWGSKLIYKALQKFPILLYVGSALLAFTGGEMIAREQKLDILFESKAFLPELMPFLSVLFVLLASILYEQSIKQKEG